jgi:chromosome segregation ATPase
MDWGTIMGYGVGLLGTGSAVAALVRSRAQNRNDRERLYFEQDQALKQTMLTELATLRAQVNLLSSDKDKLEGQISEQGRLLERLKTLDEVKDRQIAELSRRNDMLELRAAEQQTELSALQVEKTRTEQQLVTATTRADFLERENNSLRVELATLRAPAPAS